MFSGVLTVQKEIAINSAFFELGFHQSGEPCLYSVAFDPFWSTPRRVRKVQFRDSSINKKRRKFTLGVLSNEIVV